MPNSAEGKLSDNNKESVKELLSTYRTLFAMNVSGIFLVATLQSRHDFSFKFPHVAKFAVAVAGVSAALMVYLFFLALRKIHFAEDDIIYQVPVRFAALSSFALLLVAFVAILFA
jgi:esterase/lipase superfamily enzyme